MRRPKPPNALFPGRGRRALVGFGRWLERLGRTLISWARSEAAPAPLERRQLIRRAARGRGARSVASPLVRLPASSGGNAASSDKPKIIILLFAHFGDFLVSLRALQRIREAFAESSITLVCASWNAEWARRTKLFERVVVFDFFPRLNRDWRGPDSEIYDRFAALPLGSHDIAIDLRHDPDTRPCLYRIDAKVRAGYAAPVELGHPHLDLMLPAVENLLLSNGDEYSLHAELRLELLANAVVSAYARRSAAHPVHTLVDQGGDVSPARPFAILSLSAGDKIRYWPATRFAEVAVALIDRQLEIVVLGGGAESAYVGQLVSLLPRGPIKVMIDAPLEKLPALLARASLYVGLGTGLTHMSAMLGVPTVAILSGVSPVSVWRPVGPRTIALTGQTPCSPCGLTDEIQCPFSVACITAVRAVDVLAAVDDLYRDAR